MTDRRSGGTVLLGCLLVLSSCEQKSPPAPAGEATLTRATISADTAKNLGVAGDAPILCVWVDDPGPATTLEVNSESWHRGQKAAGIESPIPITAPLAAELTFVVRDGKDGSGSVVGEHAIHVKTDRGRREYSILTSKDPRGAEAPSIHGRSWRLVEPAWPLKIAGDREVAVGAVVIGGNPADDSRKSIEAVAAESDDAWVFRLRIKGGARTGP